MESSENKLRTANLSLPDRKTESLQIRLDYTALDREKSISLSVSFDGLMKLMLFLQRYQAEHKIPIPAIARPKGPPSLRLVVEED